MDNSAEIIDFNAEWMHRRILDHMNRNEMEEATFTSALLEGYLDGTFKMEFRDGEPLFTVAGKGSEGSTEGAST